MFAQNLGACCSEQKRVCVCGGGVCQTLKTLVWGKKRDVTYRCFQTCPCNDGGIHPLRLFLIFLDLFSPEGDVNVVWFLWPTCGGVKARLQPAWPTFTDLWVKGQPGPLLGSWLYACLWSPERSGSRPTLRDAGLAPRWAPGKSRGHLWRGIPSGLARAPPALALTCLLASLLGARH